MTRFLLIILFANLYLANIVAQDQRTDSICKATATVPTAGYNGGIIEDPLFPSP